MTVREAYIPFPHARVTGSHRHHARRTTGHLSREAQDPIVSNKANLPRFWAEIRDRVEKQSQFRVEESDRPPRRPGAPNKPNFRLSWPANEDQDEKQSQLLVAKPDRRGPKGACVKRSQFAEAAGRELGTGCAKQSQFRAYWAKNKDVPCKTNPISRSAAFWATRRSGPEKVRESRTDPAYDARVAVAAHTDVPLMPGRNSWRRPEYGRPCQGRRLRRWCCRDAEETIAKLRLTLPPGGQKNRTATIVIPAQAGIQALPYVLRIPACAGVTGNRANIVVWRFEYLWE